MSQPGGDVRDRVREAFEGVYVEQENCSADNFGSQLPRFLVDSLVGAYGSARAEKLIFKQFPSNRNRQLLRHQLMHVGQLDILDFLEVTINLEQGREVAHLVAFQVESAELNPELLVKYPNLLQGGLWGRVTLLYDRNAVQDMDNEPTSRVWIDNFVPHQATIDLPSWVARREQFSTNEWIELLLRSAGYHPERILGDQPRRRRWLYLARLLPLVERNLNMVELGPKNTGKTYLLRNLSPHAFSLAGGLATAANLFVNLNTLRPGLVASRKVIIFDEVAHVRFSSDSGAVSLLKDFMESGQFSRGRAAHSADASLVFLGNLEVLGAQPSSRYAHLFEPFPPELRDAALLDRMHAFIPGWEMKKLSAADLEPDYSLATDYFGEILLSLRDLPYGPHWRQVLKSHPYQSEMTQRDQTAVERVARAFFKLVFPNGHVTEPEASEILAFAGELRQRVQRQLEQMEPGEFVPHAIGFSNLATNAVARPIDFAGRPGLDAIDNRLNSHPSVGEVTALTALSAGDRIVGGDVQVIQATVIDGGRGRVRLTGQHGSSMRHSLDAAHDYLLKNAVPLGIEVDRVRAADLAVHLLWIQRGREGASAGLAFLLAMASALVNRPLRPALAVTGEVSLHGDVSAVGGVAQMLIAAHRHGRRVILLSDENLSEVTEKHLPKLVLADLKIIPVRTVRDALKLAFED
ncbi:BREX system Lon protease-like protein BrxL [Alicyclobacillaceae bacterium I2511]|nr:BREX system Lon protease-like protein BrxL [Alicyclobacillaceae bacterium I2511]